MCERKKAYDFCVDIRWADVFFAFVSICFSFRDLDIFFGGVRRRDVVARGMHVGIVFRYIFIGRTVCTSFVVRYRSL